MNKVCYYCGMLNAGENMKVITEEEAKYFRDHLVKQDRNIGACAIDELITEHLEEIDTLTVSKLRPMADAPNDGSIFLAKHEFNDELEETWSTGGGEFSTSQFTDLPIDTFDGWIPKPIYKPEKE